MGKELENFIKLINEKILKEKVKKNQKIRDMIEENMKKYPHRVGLTLISYGVQ